MIYCVEKESRLIYEARPIGQYLMARPAQLGLEHLIERLTMLEFNTRFDLNLGKYLIPDQLFDELPEDDLVY